MKRLTSTTIQHSNQIAAKKLTVQYTSLFTFTRKNGLLRVKKYQANKAQSYLKYATFGGKSRLAGAKSLKGGAMIGGRYRMY